MTDKEQLEGMMCRVETIAWLFGLTVRRIQQLTQEGILHTTETKAGSRKYTRYPLVQTIQNYTGNLNDKAKGKDTAEAVIELKRKKLEADIALKESQGELHQLKTAIASGDYISVEEVQMDYSKFFLTFKKFATNLPTRVTGIVAGRLEPAEARKLEKEINEEVNKLLEAFVVAGTRDAPQKEAKRKRGRPRKAPEK